MQKYTGAMVAESVWLLFATGSGVVALDLESHGSSCFCSFSQLKWSLKTVTVTDIRLDLQPLLILG
uniref:Secreted protein n=1 Tax=Anguilla anguilla TaxID=7936 RepID=A0A0E9WAR4_ANGAN